MERNTSDQIVAPSEEGDESLMVLDPYIQALLPMSSSSLVSENITLRDDQSAQMESPIPTTSSKFLEITEVEDDPSPRMEPSFQKTPSMFDPIEDEQSSQTNLSIQASLPRTFSSMVSENITPRDDQIAQMESPILVASSNISEIIEVEDDSSPQMEPSLLATSSMFNPIAGEESSQIGCIPLPEVNPFIKYLSETNSDMNNLQKDFSELQDKLVYGLREETVHAFLEHNMTEAKVKVQELINLFEVYEFVCLNLRSLLKISSVYEDTYSQILKADSRRIDIYYCLLNHALKYANKIRETPRVHQVVLDSMIAANLSKYFEAIDFMIFVFNKAQEEEELMSPSLPLQPWYRKIKTLCIECVDRYESETISTFICLVVNDEYKEAEDLFKSLINRMEPSDIINYGRVYNYALQKAQELLEVHKSLSNPSLSLRYQDIVQCNNRLNGLATQYDNQGKVQRFLVDLYLTDIDLHQIIDWEFVEQHDYPYLITCVCECYKRMAPNHVEYYNRTSLQQQTYVFTSSAAIVGGEDIMKHLLEAWPTLDVNASYKGIAALHVAAFKGNEEVIKCLFMQEGFDINVHTGRQLIANDVKKFLEYCKPILNNIEFCKGIMDCTKVPIPHALVLKDHEEVIKDLLFQQEIEINSKGNLDGSKFIERIAISGKKWNRNKWKLPTYQTALHIATTQGYAKIVKLLCDAPEPHQQRLRCHEEDEEDRTPVDILYSKRNEDVENSDLLEIEKILLSKQDVQNGIDRLYRNRQVLVDAVNTILVGAALIAGVTFAGWLQPPLGYAQYYDHVVPYPAPPDTYDSYLAVRGNLGVKAFALFNSLLFFFAIATVIVGADAAFPTRRYKYIGDVVETMHLLLQRAIKFLIISLVCVLGAFASAAIVVLPPSLFFRKDLVLSIIVGGGVCGYALWKLLSRHSERVQKLNAFVRHIIQCTNVF